MNELQGRHGMSEQVLAMMPAYNEVITYRTKFLEYVLKSLDDARKSGIVSEVLAIDDGSFDDTPAVCRRYSEITIHRHEKNKGKSQAFLTGLSYAICHDYPVIFMTDADMVTGISEQSLQAFLSVIVDQKNVDMIRAPYIQKGKCYNGGYCVEHYSGFRAIRTEAVADLRSRSTSDQRFWNDLLMHSFSLEAVLEHYIPLAKKRTVIIDGLESDGVGGGASRTRSICRDVNRVHQSMSGHPFRNNWIHSKWSAPKWEERRVNNYTFYVQ